MGDARHGEPRGRGQVAWGRSVVAAFSSVQTPRALPYYVRIGQMTSARKAGAAERGSLLKPGYRCTGVQQGDFLAQEVAQDTLRRQELELSPRSETRRPHPRQKANKRAAGEPLDWDTDR